MRNQARLNPIRVARRKAKLRQEDLAERVGVDQSTVSGWESGRRVPDPTNAVALTQALPGLTLEAIYAKRAA